MAYLKSIRTFRPATFGSAAGVALPITNAESMAIDLYLLLKIPRDARVDVIDQAIKTAWAEDQVPSKLLVTAQKVLLNATMRQEYDRRLAAAHKPVAPPTQATHELVFAVDAPVNPYQTARARASDRVAEDDGLAAGKLFSVAGIGIATFFGSFLAGGILLSLNYRRLANRRAANLALMICFVLAVVYPAGCYFLPDDLPIALAVVFLPLIAMIGYARAVQGAAIAAHRAAGGEMASNWLALGIGLLTVLGELLLIAVIVIGIVVAVPGLNLL